MLKLARAGEKENWNIIYGNEVCSPKTFKKIRDAIKYIKKNPIEISIVSTLIAVNHFHNSKKNETKN